jgi:GT2 family glycosyltransferase
VISGAFCFLRKKALDEVGLLDEDFFMYGEDIDLSYRLMKGGWENWYLPYPITHFKGKSTQKSDYRYVHIFYNAMLIFFRKHYSHLSLFYAMPVKMAIYFRAAIALTDILRKKLHL